MAKRDHYLDNLNTKFTAFEVDEDGNYFSITDEGITLSEVLEAKAEEKSRLDSISNTYEKADKIITGDDITVTVVNDPEMTAPATNNGREITFNADLIKGLDTESIVSLNGINYHELAHILFSPRAGSALGQYVTKGNMKRAFNMLEEARIETLLVAKYPATRPFLEANVLEYVLTSEDIADNFPMVTGRRFINLETRQIIADSFVQKYGEQVASEIHSIVNEYRSLSFPKDFTRGMELIEQYTGLVGKDTEPNKKPDGSQGNGDGDGNHNDRNPLSKGRPETSKEQTRLQEKSNGGKEGAEDIRNVPTSGTKDNKDTDSNGFIPNVGLGGNAEEMKVAEKDYSDEDSSIAKKLIQRLKDIKDDERVKNEVREIRKSITGNDEVRGTLPKSYNSHEATVNTESSTLARRFGQELERLVRDADPYWDRLLPSGKLNVSRTMTPDVNAIGQMFDIWETGSDNTDIESVVLLDNSGSMGGYMNKVCQNAWVIKRGIEYIEGKVTVFNFNSDSELLYDRKERAKPRAYRNIYPRGSTNPLKGLLEAERILTTTDRHIKILFIVTDGEWENTQECDKVIARLNNKGVVTCVVFMGDYKAIHSIMSEAKKGDEWSIGRLKNLTHKAKMFHAVATPKDVLGIATQLVKSKIGK